MLKEYFDKNVDMKITENIGERTYRFNVIDELDFDFETINDEMRDHTKKVSLLSGILEERKRELAYCKIDLEMMEAKRWEHYKATVLDDNSKALSDKRIDMMIDTDEKVVALKEKMVDLQFRVNRLMSAIAQFGDRKDLMQSFNTNYRKTI